MRASTNTPRRALRLAAAAAACALAGGCFPVIVTGTSGRPLPLERIRAIQPDLTTTRELVEWLGAPLAVGAPDSLLRVPVLDVRRVGAREIMARPDAGWAAAAPQPGDVVYYWEAVEIRDRVIQVFFYPGLRTPGTLDRRTSTDRLWVLVSGDGHRVRALVHDRRGTTTPRSPEPGPEGPP